MPIENLLIKELKTEIQFLRNENTDLKKQQIEISKAKELYLGILEEFPALIWRANTEKLCDYFNTTWLQFTGRTMEEEYGYGWAEGVHPEDLDRCIEIYNLNFDQRKSFSMEYRLKNADQEYRWILDIGRPYYDLDGTFLGYIGSCYDFTERKNTQEKLEAIQSEMKVIVQAIEQTNEMVRITDKDSIITYVNDAVLTETNYTKEELIGQKSSIFKSGKQDETFYKDLWDTVLSGNIYKKVIINRRKDGTLYHEEQTITPVFDEQKNLYFVSTGHDISERIEVEKKLHVLATIDTLTGIYNRYSLNKEIDINIKKYEELAFINIIRDIKTLSRTEIVLISSIISNSFKEKLVCDKNDALQEEEILLQEEVMENMLSIMKKNHFSTRLIGIREEGKVIVFNK